MATLDMEWYGNGLAAFLRGDIDWESDTIRVALLDAAHTPDQAAHATWDDVSGDEVSGNGYVAGGESLVAKSLTYSSSGLSVTLDAGDVSWDPSSIEARYAVVYKDTGTPSDSQLIGYGDAGSSEESVDAAFTISWNASGIFVVTVDNS